MTAFERALALLTSLEALAAERREAIAVEVIAVIEAAHGGAGMSDEEVEALDGQLRERLGSDEEIEAVFRKLLR